jgi:hypothetical protein
VAIDLRHLSRLDDGAAPYSAHGDFGKTKKLLDKPLPALTGLIGSALGFYFGSKSPNV